MLIKATMRVSKSGAPPKKATISMHLSKADGVRLMRLWLGGMRTWTYDDCFFLDWVFGLMDRITRKNGATITSRFDEMKLEECG